MKYNSIIICCWLNSFTAFNSFYTTHPTHKTEGKKGEMVHVAVRWSVRDDGVITFISGCSSVNEAGNIYVSAF